MKTLRLVTLMAVISACFVVLSGCGVKYVNRNGVSLTRPSNAVTTHTVKNNSPKSFYVGPEGEPQVEVAPQNSLDVSFKSDDEKKLCFTWYDDLGRRGEKKEEFRATYSGLNNRQIDVDEAFLWGMITLPVVITNEGDEDILIKDTCLTGIPVIVPAHGYYWTAALPGSQYAVFWWPAKNRGNQEVPQCVRTTIPTEADKMFMGRRYARGIHITTTRHFR